MTSAQKVYEELRVRLDWKQAWVNLPALDKLAWEQSVKIAWCDAIVSVERFCALRKVTGQP